MLRNLSIRDVVLIDQLDLEFDGGLGVLTGETGAGKSILLDALGLALGARGDAGLVRTGAEQAVVTAAFEIAPDHAVIALCDEHGLPAEDGAIVLRRTLGADGRSRAFVNDQSVSVGLQRRIGESLVEIHGQFDSRGLLDPATHLAALDAFAGLEEARAAVAEAHAAASAARVALETAETETAEARAQEDAMRAIAAELDALEPQSGEERTLAEQRDVMQHAGQLLDALASAALALSGDDGEDGGAESGIQRALRDLERVAARAGGRFDGLLAALERAAAELAEAMHALNAASQDIDADPGALERVEERLFALRAAARKYAVAVDDLPALQADTARRLAAIGEGGGRLAALARDLEAARRRYVGTAESLSKARHAAARRLDAAVTRELPPLRLDKARFTTALERMPESGWGPNGLDRVSFVVATNPGSAPGPLNRIASGGELSRFMLALRVVLSATGAAAVLVFDEVDAGIGGATAAAVGERLAQLADSNGRQVLVVTHSPQVAAIGAAHWHVSKQERGSGRNARTTTQVARLDRDGRREEIARMLSGAAITDEARAAADRLLDAAARTPDGPAPAAGARVRAAG
jgi:DNA repair protein RecN (Recombination protein N)